MMSIPDFYSTIVKLCGSLATVPALTPLLDTGEEGQSIGAFLLKMEDPVDVILHGSEKMNRMAQTAVPIFFFFFFFFLLM